MSTLSVRKQFLIALAIVACMVTSSLAVIVSLPQSARENKVGEVQGSPASAVRLSIVGMPTTTESGSPIDFLLIALDKNGAVSTGYKGTVAFNSTDPLGTVPNQYTFIKADAGQHWFTGGSLKFITPGIRTFTVYDISNPSINGNFTLMIRDSRVVLLDEHFDSWSSLDSHWTVWNCTNPPYNTINVAGGALVMSDPALSYGSNDYNAKANWTYPITYQPNLTISFKVNLPFDDYYKQGIWGQWVAVELYDSAGTARVIIRFLMDTWTGAPNGFTYVSSSNVWTKIAPAGAGWHTCSISLMKGSSQWVASIDGVYYYDLSFAVTPWSASDLSRVTFTNALREEPAVALFDDVKIERVGPPAPPPPPKNTPPVAGFVVSPQIGNADTYFLFNANSSYDKEDPVSALKFRWDWQGDGIWDTAWSSVKMTTHCYHEGGVFFPRLQVMDTGGLTGAANQTVFVDAEPPFADAGPDIVSIGGANIHLSGAGSFDTQSGIADYEWSWTDWNESHIVHGMSPIVSMYYTSQATIIVDLKVTDGAGNVAHDQCRVTVWPAPVMVLKYGGKDSKVSTAWGVIAPDDGFWTISLMNHGLRSAYVEVINYWNFTYKGTVKFQYPESTVSLGPFRMVSGQQYQVDVWPTGNAGTYLLGANAFVSANSPPIARITIDSINGTAVYANAVLSEDIDGDSMRFVWDWGDGTRSYGMISSHTYATYGLYTVTLKAIDDAGEIGIDALVLSVYPPPVAVISVVSINGLTVNVDGSHSYCPGGRIISYSWEWGDGGMWTFPSANPLATHTYASAGTYLLGLEVFSDTNGVAYSSRWITVEGSPPAEPYKITTIYDMFEQPWGDWWTWRLQVYGLDYVLHSAPGQNTILYNPDARGYQGIIYAPYRMNVSAFQLTNLNAYKPEFMPVLGSKNVSGSQASIVLYFEYLDVDWWDSYWVPTWSTKPHFPGQQIMTGQMTDGYYLGVVYKVVLNRAAAFAWLGMPLNADPMTWWSANYEAYRSAWISWLLNEGNNRLDIYSAYEFPMVDLGTMMDISIDYDGSIVLNIGHISWGYEVLMTRWLTETNICNHEPWYEDFYLTAHYSDFMTQWVSFDACCQQSLHAVNGTLTQGGAAWVWEPNSIDYIPSSFNHPSTYDPYVGLTYTSENAGDPLLEQQVSYEYTPTAFSLGVNSELRFQLPTGTNVMGYAGWPVPPDAILKLRMGDYSAYENLESIGPMRLGYYAVSSEPNGGPDLSSMYDPINNTLIIHGPVSFDNVRHPNGALYHGTPWIEFDVGPYVYNRNPVAIISGVWQSLRTVTVDGGDSYDLDGNIIWYRWYWGDGTLPSEGASMTTGTHTYAAAGTYTIHLEVVDNGGCPGNAYLTVTVHAYPAPPFNIMGYTNDSLGERQYYCEVTVTNLRTGEFVTNNSGSFGFYLVNINELPNGWLVGDVIRVSALNGGLSGTKDVQLTFNNTASPFLQVDIVLRQTGPPPPPIMVVGYTYDTNGVPLLGCVVNLTDLRTGLTLTTTSSEMPGLYIVDINTIPGGWLPGDTIRVTATLGPLKGTATFVITADAPGPLGYIQADVILS